MPTVWNQNIENNPMQRKEPYENKGVRRHGCMARKNILTRRANQRHIFSIPPSAKCPPHLGNVAEDSFPQPLHQDGQW
ncbi:MAG TPA: hypothetical protein VK630_16145, partial [Reyranella sp.]|nr:hypothetical protein [Reyranella sp.]